MVSKDLGSLLLGVTVTSQGSPDFNDNIAMPLIRSATGSLMDAGFRSAVENPQLPPHHARLRYEFRMEAGLAVAALVGLTVFIGSSVAAWAIDKVCDELWGRYIGPALSNARRRHDQSDSPMQPFVFQFRVYYGHDEIAITVRALIASDADFDAAVKLIPEAERKALAWLEEKGIDCEELVYTMRDGELSHIPRKIASVQPNKRLQPSAPTKRKRRG